MNREHKIYMIKNIINNKMYIGQTVNSLEERFKQHCNKIGKRKSKFYKALEKYGKDNFIISLIEDKIPYEQINQKEKYYIQKYNTVKAGYNTSPGGDSKYILEIEQNIIVKEYLEGKSASIISQLYNVSEITILRILHANNVETRIDNLKKEKIKDSFIPMYLNKNITTKEIAKYFNITEYSVRRWGRKFNLPHRERKRNGIEKL